MFKGLPVGLFLVAAFAVSGYFLIALVTAAWNYAGLMGLGTLALACAALVLWLIEDSV